ncbi:hypothetical protein H0H92_005167 [Tricholoma furcatifolium]|nr:hypothetical protein H0H92_005167 [Tricholoma furcatifolium]
MVAVTLGTTLGAILIGCIIAGMIYGASCFQMFKFSQESKDPWIFKAIIFFLWVLDTTVMALIIHAVYHYAVIDYSNGLALEFPVWLAALNSRQTVWEKFFGGSNSPNEDSFCMDQHAFRATATSPIVVTMDSVIDIHDGKRMPQ